MATVHCFLLMVFLCSPCTPIMGSHMPILISHHNACGTSAKHFVTWHIVPQPLQQDLDNKSTTVLISTATLIDIPLQKLRDAQIYRGRC